MACTSAPLCNQCAKTCSALHHTKPQKVPRNAHPPPARNLPLPTWRQRCPGSPARAPELANVRLHAARAQDEGTVQGCSLFTLEHRQRVAWLQTLSKQQHEFLRTQCGGTIARVLSEPVTKLVLAYTHNHSAGPHVHMPCQQRTSISPDAGRHGISGVHHPRPHPAASAAACVAARVGALCKLLGRLCRAAHVPHVFRIQARCRGAPIGCASAPCRSISNNARI